MMRSMFAGVSGLRNHQTRMDVIGNNIANVNTIGYKTSRVTFADTLSQTIRGATAPQNNRGGVNPQQVGLGVTLSSIDVIHTPGNPQSTGVNTDLAIQGNGFFVLSDGSQEYYTRAGNFSRDPSGRLVYSNGLQLQGWMLDDNGQIIGELTGITLPINSTIAPKNTGNVYFSGNLHPSADNDTNPTVVSSNIEVVDSLGRTHLIEITFTQSPDPLSPREWTWGAIDSNGTTIDSGNLEFDAVGQITGNSTFPITWTPSGGANTLNFNLDFSQLTQYVAVQSSVAYNQDGYEMGYMDSFKIDSAGKVIGIYSNGLTKEIAQIAVANFPNPAGLEKMGETMFRKTSNSGTAQYNIPGVGGSGTISPGSLEMSNVDLSQEFTDMIVTQRGFQANSRIITTSDEMLQELVNLKR
ncbi:MAG: flagellar hook protein FlgE [Firmicutes bacterium]|nr:flagellar hook protein FlgE [Bacillota bacterium]